MIIFGTVTGGDGDRFQKVVNEFERQYLDLKEQYSEKHNQSIRQLKQLKHRNMGHGESKIAAPRGIVTEHLILDMPFVTVAAELADIFSNSKIRLLTCEGDFNYNIDLSQLAKFGCTYKIDTLRLIQFETNSQHSFVMMTI